MPDIIKDNIGTIVACLIVAALAICACIFMIRQRRKGKSCSCGCEGCAYSGYCSKAGKKV